MIVGMKACSAAAIVSALALPALAAGKPPAACAPGKASVARVAAALDGGTLTLDDGRVIVLAGIDAPLPPIGAPDRASPIAAAATAALAAATRGVPVKVALVDDKPDRYGRLRANVFGADGTSLAAAAVAAGLARVHRLPGDPACVLAVLDVERQARIAGRGLWADPDYRIRSATDPSLIDQTGLYGLVAGRVISVGHGDVMLFVNFGRDYDRDFTVMVAPAVAKGLTAAGIDLDALADRRVLVRGMIENDGGPLIRLTDPTDIEVIGDGGE
jgi:endonuclease YncB( thermonuclease family)